MANTDRPNPGRRLPAALQSVLLAIAVTVLAYPVAVFLGGSLSHVGMGGLIDRGSGREVVSLFPNPEDRTPDSGLVDVGARAWQFDPATKFMNRALYDGQDPSWNPYSASGSLGPETLADMKLSPFVLAVAVLGASSTAFTLVLLAMVALALYCLQQFFTRTLGMGRLAATAACVVFVLNGFATSLLSGQVGAPYLLFPVALYALAEFQRVGGPVRFLVAVAAYAALIVTTFLPVVLLMLLFIHAVALLLDAIRRRSLDGDRSLAARAGVLLGRQAAVPVCAFSATAVLWLPTIDAYLNSGQEIARYRNQTLVAQDPLAYLTLLTPRHIYRSYLVETIPSSVTSYTVYLGIAPLLVVAGALPRARGRARALLWLTAAVVLLAVLLHMGMPVVERLGRLPGLRMVDGLYWAALAAAGLTIAVGIAIDTAVRAGLSTRAVVIAGSVFAAGFAVAVVANWRPSQTALASIAVAGLTIVAVAVLAWLSRRYPHTVTVVVALIIGLVVVELMSYQNHTMVKRYDYEDQPPEYLAFVREGVGDGRVLNAGRDGLFPEWGSAFGIRQLETLNVMQIPEYRAFFYDHLNPREGGGKFLQIGSAVNVKFGPDPAALDQLSVRYLIVTDALEQYNERAANEYPLVFDDDAVKVKVYENPDAFPRAYLSPILVPENEVTSADPRWTMERAFTEDQALFDDATAAGVSTTEGDPGDGGGDARIVAESNTVVRVEADARAPSVLVLTDVFHDNWKVSVNGEPAHLARVNDVVRGVVVPAGASTVVFHYESAPRQIGMVISIVTIVSLLVGSMAWALQRRRVRAAVGDPEPAPVG